MLSADLSSYALCWPSLTQWKKVLSWVPLMLWKVSAESSAAYFPTTNNLNDYQCFWKIQSRLAWHIFNYLENEFWIHYIFLNVGAERCSFIFDKHTNALYSAPSRKVGYATTFCQTSTKLRKLVNDGSFAEKLQL